MLRDILKEEYIKLNVECKNWEEAIRKAGEILLKSSIVTEEYIEETVRELKELGPYTVIDNGVAIPHASNHKGVNKTGVALVTLKEPVCFKGAENRPFKYILMLATTDMDTHIEVLSKVSSLLEKPEFLKVIEKAKETETIMKYLVAEEK